MVQAITLRQRDGGEILLGGFVTASTHKDLDGFDLVTPSGQGTNQTLVFQNHDKLLLLLRLELKVLLRPRH